MAKPPNNTVGARQSSRVSYVGYKKNLVIYGLPFRTENGSEREIPCKGPIIVQQKKKERVKK